jgi:hypothetical protein
MLRIGRSPQRVRLVADKRPVVITGWLRCRSLAALPPLPQAKITFTGVFC